MNEIRKRCPICNAPIHDGQGSCGACGYDGRVRQPTPGPEQKRPFPQPLPRPVNQNTRPAPSNPDRPPIIQHPPIELGTRDGILQGTIVRVQPPVMERPDANGYKRTSILLMCLLFLPFVFLLTIIALAWNIVCFIFGLRPARPSGSFLFLILGIGRGRQNDVPVVNFTVRTDQGRQHAVRLKGYLVRGSLNPGDRVSLRGRFDQGTLLFQSGVNYTLNTMLEPAPNRWRIVFWILLVVFSAMVLWMISSGMNFYDTVRSF